MAKRTILDIKLEKLQKRLEGLSLRSREETAEIMGIDASEIEQIELQALRKIVRAVELQKFWHPTVRAGFRCRERSNDNQNHDEEPIAERVRI